MKNLENMHLSIAVQTGLLFVANVTYLVSLSPPFFLFDFLVYFLLLDLVTSGDVGPQYWNLIL